MRTHIEVAKYAMSKAQREKFISMRSANPSLRIRDDCSLGPRKTVEVTSAKRSTLKAPKTFFVELDVYKRDYPDKVLMDKDIVWEEISPGQWKQGVAWL